MNAHIFCFLLLVCFESANAQTLLTVAGGGPTNLPALQTGLPRLGRIAIDSSGNAYFCTGLNQIWIVDTAGKVRVFAGIGTTHLSMGIGDGLQATAAAFSPVSLVFDTSGNLLFIDGFNHSVRKVSASGVISSVAGVYSSATYSDPSSQTMFFNGGFSQMAIDSSNNIYIADSSNRRIWQVSSAGVVSSFAGGGTSGRGDGGPAIAANLMYPVGVAVDSTGSVYISDYVDCRVRKVTSGTISTFAGTGVCSSTGNGQSALSATIIPSDLMLDRFDNLYIVSGCSVREIAANQPNISSYLGGPAACGTPSNGTAVGTANFGLISGIAFDATGSSTYVADSGNNRIWKVQAGLVSTFAGNGTADLVSDGQLAANAYIDQLGSVVTDNAGSILFSDGFSYGGSSTIRRFSLTSGVLGTVAGSGVQAMSSADGAPAASAANDPSSAIFNLSGEVVFIEGNRIRKITNGAYATIANSSGGNGFVGDGGLATAAQLNLYELRGTRLAIASSGDLYIADTGNYRIRQISAKTGIISTIAGAGGSYSSGDGGLAISANLNNPSALSLDGIGDLFFTEPDRVRKIVLKTGIVTTVAGGLSYSFQDGQLATSSSLAPASVFADQSGNLFISDARNYRIRKVSADTNLISTIAGNGSTDTSSDGGSPTSSAITPVTLTVDHSQKLYFVDFPSNSQEGRIRTFPVTACFFSLSAPSGSFNSASGTGSVSVTATNSSCPYTVASDSPFVTITSGSTGTGTGTVTFALATNTGSARSATVSFGGQTFTVNQAAGSAQYNVGYFQPSGGPLWALDANGNGQFDAGDKLFSFLGQAGDIAVTGDWNGDGHSKIGLYRNGFWLLDYNGNGIWDGPSGGDKFYGFGGNGTSFVPVVGDWNADGRTKVGYYLNGFWVLDVNGNGIFDGGDSFFAYGGNGSGEVPLLGDWNGDKRTKIGFFYQGKWVLDYDGNGTFDVSVDRYFASFPYLAGDKPVTGDWSGDGKTKIGIYRGGFWILDNNGNGIYDGVGSGGDKFYAFGGSSTDTPIVADWNGDGRSKVGLYNSGFWTLDFNGNGSFDGLGTGGDRFIAFGGTPGNQYLVGRW